MHFLTTLGWTWLLTALGVLAGAGVLHAIPKLGDAGKRASDWLCAGFPLDVVVGYFTVLPLVLGPIFGGWGGLVGGVLGGLTGLVAWELIHEAVHYKTRGRAALLKATNKMVGVPNNLFACFWTAWCVPLFAAVRFAEWFVYPPLTWTTGMPKYDGREWVNVSRHKFQGLVGHDRIWCLYCDWMTGVWSLGTEMLRNVESFWCPIRYSSEAKCANCVVDFPDIDGGWVDFNTDNVAAAEAIKAHYGENGEVRPRSWWGHPDRKGATPVVKTHDGNGHSNGKKLPPGGNGTAERPVAMKVNGRKTARPIPKVARDGSVSGVVKQ